MDLNAHSTIYFTNFNEFYKFGEIRQILTLQVTNPRSMRMPRCRIAPRK